MAMSPLLRVLTACALLLLPAAAANAEKAQPTRPVATKTAASELAKARTLMKLRRYDLALSVLRPDDAAPPGPR